MAGKEITIRQYVSIPIVVGISCVERVRENAGRAGDDESCQPLHDTTAIMTELSDFESRTTRMGWGNSHGKQPT